MGAQTSLYSQITKISGMLISQGCLFKEVAQPYSAQKAGNEGELQSELSEGPGHINLIQPGPKILNNLDDPYIICMTRGSLKFPH